MSADRWRAIIRAVGADRPDVRRWLDLVAAEKSITCKQLVRKHSGEAQKYRRWLADLPAMTPPIPNPDQCRAEWQGWAQHHEEEARFWQRRRRELPYRRIAQLRIVGVWFLHRGEQGLEPAQAWPFYAAAHEYVFDKHAPNDLRAFRKLLQEFRKTVVADLKRQPVRLFGIPLA